MFAERGLRATTVRDIADGAGILSGSLYHHFASKEEMVDELLRGFLDWLFARYREIVDSEANPLERLRGLFMASFEAISTAMRRSSSIRTRPSDCYRSRGSPTSRI